MGDQSNEEFARKNNNKKLCFCHSYHKALHNAKVLMDDLGQRCQAVSSAGSIAGGKKQHREDIQKVGLLKCAPQA